MASLSGAGAGVLLASLSTNNLLTPVDLLIFGALLVVTLIVGLSTRRPIKTIQDYALGGKNFSTATLVATIVATWFGAGSVASYPEHYYNKGLLVIIPYVLGAFLGMLFTGQVMAVRMKDFARYVSPAEGMGSMYGKTVQIISGISGSVFQIGLTAAQFQVMAKVLSLVWGYQDMSFLILVAVTMIFYSAWGGIRAVTFTDVVQFLTFGAFIPILALVMWGNLQGTNQITVALAQHPGFHLRIIVWNAEFINAIALMIYFTTIGINPYMFQRIAMARNIQQAKTAFTYAGFIALSMLLLLVWVAILMLADNTSLAPGQLLNYFIAQSSFTGFKGLLAAGIVALAMSTADSSINACVVLLTNDVAVPLGLSKSNSIFTLRLSTVIVGLLGLGLALYGKDLLYLLFLSSGFYLPIAGAPLLLAIFGFRSSKRGVLISMAAGLTTVILWRSLLAHTGIDSLIPATLVNILFLLGSYYLLGYGDGWQQVDPDSPLGLARAARREAWQRRLQALRTFKLYSYLQELLPVQEGVYTLLGFYAMAATYIGLYTIDRADVVAYDGIYTGIYQTVLVATTALITVPIWPSIFKNKRFISFFWPMAMGAILLFTGTLLVILSHFHPLQVMVLMSNFLLVALLLRWPMAIILAFSAIGSAVLFFKQYTGESLPWGVLDSLELRIIYTLLIFTALLLAFFVYQEAFKRLGKRNAALQTREKDQQASLVQVSTEKQAALAALQYTGVEKLLTITRKLEAMHVAEEDKEQMKALQTELLPIAFQLQGLNTRAQDYLRLQKAKMPLKGWCDKIKSAVVEQGVTSRLYCTNKAECGQIKCDPQGLTSLVVNSIVLLNTQLESLEDTPPIFFRIEDTQLSYPLPDVRKGYIKYVPAVRIAITVSDDLPVVKDSYSAELNGPSQPPMPKTVEDLARHANSRIVKSHYGYEEVTDDTLIYVVPVDVEDVRPQDMDKDYMEVGAMPKRANDHFKNEENGIDAQAQEAAFLADVAARSDANIDMIQTALEAIKWYHGPKNRNSGEPFYLHPLTVARIVLDYNTDEETIIGALLHDTVEDTSMQLEQIEDRFGKATAEVVNVVTHLQSIPHSIYKVKMSAVENLQMLERTGNKRGLYVKLADRIHNMRTINGHSSIAKRKLIAQETIEFFVPLARKLGLEKAAVEFEKMCLEVFKQKG